VKVRTVIRAVGLACLATAPSALIFGFVTRSYAGLWYFMLALHCLALICATVVFLLPQERQWRFITALAELSVRTGKNPDPESYELLRELEELERKEKEDGRERAAHEDAESRRSEDLWGARRRGGDARGDTEKDGHGDTETR